MLGLPLSEILTLAVALVAAGFIGGVIAGLFGVQSGLDFGGTDGGGRGFNPDFIRRYDIIVGDRPARHRRYGSPKHGDSSGGADHEFRSGDTGSQRRRRWPCRVNLWRESGETRLGAVCYDLFLG